MSATETETVAIVVVTFNRADLLVGMLAGLEALERCPEAVIVLDNASTDHTAEVLGEARDRGTLALQVITSPENVGGAGGFHIGVRTAYEQGFDRIWLMDDDVVPAPDCLGILMATDEDCLTSVREDTSGRLVEKAATRFDLRNPFAIKPKTGMVETDFATRAAMPERVEVENVAFEGFLVRRAVIEEIGLPDPAYFIFYDDVDLALRARRTGRRIWAVRDAVLVRQLDFDQQHDLAGWKGYYMYRNLFVVHLRYGENVAVRLKPWLVALVVVLLSPLRGGRAEARNVLRAVRDARTMRDLSASASPEQLSRSADPGPA
ncbi:rhamnosyltransferase [Nocardioides psychrotolerans]|uniref:Glycosyltransferase, GT2 family n=1 Tax=Nocardioides psychrotolerans TaxID=1005945 RepID=A0A1I3BA37_9ACTN|nr:glycosyltransferase family 2 protein [Nocardioides psychrotolerans]GEP36766.1 rhamnosyltransferase [Nocardioides psychrotolerans]SFH59040.1 Glycosyltransferase, GT2 family [Nocardioides psychrotolerans]